MSDRIKPALDADQWRSALEHFDHPFTGAADSIETCAWGGEWPAVIALANHALPDTDPRKITRDWVRAMRDLANAIESAQGSKMVGAIRLTGPAGTVHVSTGNDWRGMADALESYLPPEAP